MIPMEEIDIETEAIRRSRRSVNDESPTLKMVWNRLMILATN